jgi:hypothetical protein
MDMESAKAECKVSSCGKSSIVALGGQDLCLDHFLASCYEQLDKLELLVRRQSLSPTESLAAGIFLEECASCTLVICLRHEHLSNMDRSRLLNVLLMTGELRLQLRKPLLHLADTSSPLSAVFLGKTPSRASDSGDQTDF